MNYTDATQTDLELCHSNQVEGIIKIVDGKVVALNARAAQLLNISQQQTSTLPLITVVRNHKIEEVYLTGKSQEVSSQGKLLQVSPCDIGLSIIDISELRKVQDDTSELLAVLSHEFRTPVTAIRSTIEALYYDLPLEKKETILNRATTEVERLTRLLNDLTVDVKPPNLRRLSLKEHIARAEGLLNQKLRENNITFKSETEDFYVIADSDKLLQILLNLIENAIVHGPKDATITLKATVQNNVLHIVVEDEGEPLNSATIEQLFEPHSRGSSNKAKGTGLGLYIVRNIAKTWDGEAWGQALETGNCFGFSVPLA